MLLGISQPLQPISNLSMKEARKRKQESLKLALRQGKKLPKATPSRTSTKKKLHGNSIIPQTPTPEKKQKTKEDTDAEKVTMIYPLIHKLLKITRPGKTSMLEMKLLTTMMKFLLLTIMFTQKKSKRNILHFVSSNGDGRQMKNSELGSRT